MTPRSLHSPPRFYSLDALRGVAALSVALWHWQHFFFAGTTPGPIDVGKLPVLYRIFLLYTPSWQTFDLFFSLSGFVLYWIYSQRIAERRVTVGAFFWLRFSRLYPLHLATLLIVGAGQLWLLSAQGSAFVYADNDGPHFLAQLAVASSWGPERGDSFNGPVWSLSVEVLLLIVFFACCLVFPIRLRVLMVLSLAGFLVVRSYNPAIGRAMGAFFLGGCVYLLYQRVMAQSPTAVWRIVCWVVGLTVGGWAVYLASATWLSALAAAYPGADVTRLSVRAIPVIGHVDGLLQWAIPKVFRYWATIVVFPLTIMAFALCETYRGTLGKRIAVLGDISYSLFLLHFPLQLVVVTLVDRFQIDRAIYYSPWFMAFFFVMLTVASLGSYRYFERPVKQFLRRGGLIRAPSHPPELEPVTRAVEEPPGTGFLNPVPPVIESAPSPHPGRTLDPL